MYGTLIVTFLLMLLLFARTGHFVSCLARSAGSGLLGLLAVYGAGLYTTPLLIISPLSLAVSTLLGLPGVIGLLLCGVLL